MKVLKEQHMQILTKKDKTNGQTHFYILEEKNKQT